MSGFKVKAAGGMMDVVPGGGPGMSWKHVGFTGKKWDSTSNMVILTKNEGHTGYNGGDL